MKNIFYLICIFFLTRCNSNTDSTHSNSDSISGDTLIEKDLNKIITDWRLDSLGCMKIRKYENIKYYVNAMELMGKDSIEVFNYLGEPNARTGEAKSRHFMYFAGCVGKGKVSYYNIYLHFDSNKLARVNSAVH